MPTVNPLDLQAQAIVQATQSVAIQQMVATAFLMRRPTQIDSLILDCTVTESHTLENEVTDHPVEQGFNVTDHVRPKPDVVTIQGIISNTPFSRTHRRRIVQALGITFESATDEDRIIGQPGYAEGGYASLRDIRDNGKLVTVTTRLRTYENMVMTSLVVPRNKDVGDALLFTATFKLIRIVQNKLAVAKKSTAPGKRVSTGKQVPKKTDNPTQQKSIAYELREQAPSILKKLGLTQ